MLKRLSREATLGETSTAERVELQPTRAAQNRRGRRVMYHVALAEARQSIEQHGLDWRRLELGSAYRPPGIYLWDSLDFALWYAQAAYDDYDIWAVGIGGLELLPDPGFGEFAGGVQHTWLSPQPIAAERLLGIEASDGGTVAEDN